MINRILGEVIILVKNVKININKKELLSTILSYYILGRFKIMKGINTKVKMKK